MDSELTKFEPLAAEQRALMLQSESSVWLNVAKFEQSQRVATMLSKTDFIPEAFRGHIGNCMIALDLAERMHAHPIMLMQTMYIVHGRPGFEGKFVSALVNNSGRYEGKLKYEWKGEKGKPSWGCRAWAILKGTDERVDGPWVDWEMVVAEGWNKPKPLKSGGTIPSKWTTMPQVLFMYRAASFFGKTHDSDLLMGMSTIEEIEDMELSSPTMIKQPDGSFAATAPAKTADLYAPTQQSPLKTKETSDVSSGIDSGPAPGNGNGSTAPADPWKQDWNKSKLKGTGVKEYAEVNKDTFKLQSRAVQQAFMEKWHRVLGMQLFPFDIEGNWIGKSEAATETQPQDNMQAQDVVLERSLASDTAPEAEAQDSPFDDGF